MLTSKIYKQEFDELFDTVCIVYIISRECIKSYPPESIFMGVIFYNYKQLLQITKEDNAIDERTLEYELTSLLETKQKQNLVLQV
jgi:hypothetical protein